jgi:hypothetical protein
LVKICSFLQRPDDAGRVVHLPTEFSTGIVENAQPCNPAQARFGLRHRQRELIRTGGRLSAGLTDCLFENPIAARRYEFEHAAVVELQHHDHRRFSVVPGSGDYAADALADHLVAYGPAGVVRVPFHAAVLGFGSCVLNHAGFSKPEKAVSVFIRFAGRQGSCPAKTTE